jgi:signal transduction histidine kinase
MMDAIVAAAIHDAKNSLNALGTWLVAAEREHASPAIAEARAIASRIGDELVELLALYRESEGSLRLAVEDHDLADFLADLAAEFRPPADAQFQLDLDAALAAETGAWAFDCYQVRLVLLDALRNAARHARARIRLGMVPAGKGISFEVRDDGPGYPGGDPLQNDAAMMPGSSGLGLRFAQLIARRHKTPDGRQGHIEMCNDNGAVFRLFLP